MTTTSNANVLANAVARAIALTVLCIASSVMAQPKPPEFSGRIDVRDVEPSALLYAVADTVNINIVAPVVPSGQRVSISTDFSSIDDLLQKLAKSVSMNGVLLGQRILVLSPCLHREARNTPPRATGPLTIRLPDATLREAISLASQELPSKVLDNEPLLQRRITARLINVSRDDVLQSSFVAFGGELVADTTRNPNDLATSPANCSGVASTPAAPQQQRAQALHQRTNHCPYRAAEHAKSCQPLEFFRLEQVFPRGYFEAMGRRVAFVEAPDELLHVVHRGTYIGQNYGKVQEISRSGIEMEEIVLDRLDIWQKSASKLQHWATPSAPQSH
jgi:Tfp pilus assembly protein PilP